MIGKREARALREELAGAAERAGRDAEQRRALEQRHELLRAVLSELSGDVVACDASGRLLLGSEADEGVDPLDWAQHLGIVAIDGRPPTPADVPLYRALHGATVEHAELTVSRDGGLRTLHVTARPVAERLGAVMTVADVTEMRATQARLRESEERYRTVIEGVRDTVFQTDLSGRWRFLGGGFEAATGFRPEEMVGRLCWDLVHPDDRTAHARAFAPLAAGDVSFIRHRHRVVTATGAVRWAEARAQLLRTEAGAPAGIAGVIEDVSDEHRAQQYASAERAVLDVLAGAAEPRDAMPAILEALGRHLDWDLAELWTPDEAGEHLVAAGTWRAAAGALSEFERRREGMALEIGDGLPGQAWAQRCPVWSPDISADARLPRSDAAAASGLRSALALPVAVGPEVVAVALFASGERREPETSMDRLLEAIASHIGQYVERARLLDELRAAATAPR